MNAGSLRHRLTLETPSSTRDEYGENVPKWTPITSVFGSIKQLSEKQLAMAAAKSITTTSTHEIRMRFTRGLGLRVGYHRLRFETEESSRTFTINSIANPDERNRELVLTVTEVIQ